MTEPIGPVSDAAVRADPAFVSAAGLTKAFGAHVAVDDVSLEVAKGEVISIIGPSGAGKSSLIRCLNLLEVPDHGSLRIGDARVDFTGGSLAKPQVRALRAQTGMVFQAFNLFPHFSALKNVALPQMRVHKRSRAEAEERAMAELTRVGLASKANAYPAECSGGQQQRIAIARALAMDPELMLFDEPTSGLDPEIGAEILQVMRGLAADDMTMLIVTHEMEFARHVSNRVVVMVDGAVIEEGPPEQIMTQPEHERTQQFLSAVLGR
ncbi:amino acid ABC transporter ATP-binding protein [Leucobacter rhizosphaerae]|uniref:Amino acid ABC transporter ATP-binding protein n=2 Tax=Leucobacter rhizosphaerae TaxID=2932245 RepID=A0ABY4FZS8_9MICO|nr:amino acid ABC transporter ATP-binding protein [Leucobacter rhizosphaerae]UOQ61805.1 amino acid ABC transporter ATP-binding protein [Leucobacter rhizosphaerae]